MVVSGLIAASMVMTMLPKNIDVEVHKKSARVEQERAVNIKKFNPLLEVMYRPIKEEVKLNVPFTSQAPYKNWTSPYDEACEEASLLMLEYYINGDELTVEKANTEILKLTDSVAKNGWQVDMSTKQLQELAKKVYKRRSVRYTGDSVTIKNIKLLISAGYPVVVPTDGKKLKNTNFKNGGPKYHMIVLVGYDKAGFYAHDPGTQFGAMYKYSYDTIRDSIHEWTGDRKTISRGEKAMLVLEKGDNYASNIKYSF